MTDPVRVQFQAGEHIEGAARRLVELAGARGAVGSFNDIELTATAKSNPAEIVAYFNAECDRRAVAYRSSPEGIAAAQATEQRRAAAQGKHDALMLRLPRLNMADDTAVLDWLCEMQEPSDHVGVIVRRKTIVEHFTKAGYRISENTGADYRKGDRDNTFRYLVGQALDGLSTGPAIHPIIQKFANEWRDQFGVRAA